MEAALVTHKKFQNGGWDSQSGGRPFTESRSPLPTSSIHPLYHRNGWWRWNSTHPRYPLRWCSTPIEGRDPSCGGMGMGLPPSPCPPVPTVKGWQPPPITYKGGQLSPMEVGLYQSQIFCFYFFFVLFVSSMF